MEHCVSTFSEYCRDKAFKIYVTDGIKCMSESLASNFGGAYLQERYADIFEGREKDESPKTGDEIVLDIISRAGLKVRGE